jgi:hypothetical protein
MPDAGARHRKVAMSGWRREAAAKAWLRDPVNEGRAAIAID